MGEEDNGNEIRMRAGTFFLVVGIGLLVLFFLSDLNGQFNLWFFILGAMLTGLGFYISVRVPQNRQPSQRFAGIRKMVAKSKAAKEARAKAKAEKAAQKAAKKKK